MHKKILFKKMSIWLGEAKMTKAGLFFKIEPTVHTYGTDVILFIGHDIHNKHIPIEIYQN